MSACYRSRTQQRNLDDSGRELTAWRHSARRKSNAPTRWRYSSQLAGISAGACGTLLAHLGATVLYVEGHNLPGEMGTPRHFALGKEPVDTSRRAQSVAAADIIITSSDIDEEQTEYPRAIHIIAAFGPRGPLAGKPYSDALIQALTGVADTNGQEDGGPAAGAPILEYEAAMVQPQPWPPCGFSGWRPQPVRRCLALWLRDQFLTDLSAGASRRENRFTKATGILSLSVEQLLGERW